MAFEDFKTVDLPPMPQVVAKIIQIDENNIDVSSDQIQSLIAVDPALTSKILKIANSAFYAQTSKVSNLSQAVTLLGFRTIKSLTLLVSSKDMFPAKKETMQIQKELWMRSVLCALISKLIAEKINEKEILEEVFMAGLLQNIGQLILHNKFSEKYAPLFESSTHGVEIKKLHQLENKEFNITSVEVSALTMQKWNFPKDLIVSAKKHALDSKSVNSDNTIHLVASLAYLVVLLGGLTDSLELDDKNKEYINKLFVAYSEKLKIDESTQNYLLNDLEKEIKEDSFYSFCSELFSS